MILCISAVSVVTSPFSFLILLIWVFSLFFLISLANGLSFLFIFSKNQLYFYWSLLSFPSFLFHLFVIWSLWFLSSANFGVFLFFFYNCFRCKVRFFIWDVSCFLRYGCIAINFPLRTAFAASHRFWVVVFSLSFLSRYFLISSLISSVISSLLSSVLFSLHVFVFFTDFYL